MEGHLPGNEAHLPWTSRRKLQLSISQTWKALSLFIPAKLQSRIVIHSLDF